MSDSEPGDPRVLLSDALDHLLVTLRDDPGLAWIRISPAAHGGTVRLSNWSFNVPFPATNLAGVFAIVRERASMDENEESGTFVFAPTSAVLDRLDEQMAERKAPADDPNIVRTVDRSAPELRVRVRFRAGPGGTTLVLDRA